LRRIANDVFSVTLLLFDGDAISNVDLRPRAAKLHKGLQMKDPAEGGMKQNSLSSLKALLLTSATQQCPIKDMQFVSPS
jgi:hypothetical protein